VKCLAPGCARPREVGALFCAEDMKAPAGKRGGWISAERRRRARGASSPQEPPLDISNVARRLWVGAKPPFDRPLPDFDVLVLCAQELQPTVLGFQGRVIRVPLPDSHLTDAEAMRAIHGSKLVAQSIVDGKRVLVTCQAGWNRSALIASLALARVTRMSGDELIAHMKAKRHPNALSNPHFQEILRRLARR
jgi:hypothetical protein